MKTWIKDNKFRLIISSVVTLLPILYGFIIWDSLPDTMITHFGADGVADGFSNKLSGVLTVPLILFAVNILMLCLSALDSNNRNGNKKAMRLVFWIFPGMSIIINGLMYSVALEKEFCMEKILFALLGILFVVFGNYMPKIQSNRTMGIKISWTLGNEENWNKTHRLAGKLWVFGGLVMLVLGFFPGTFTVYTLIACIFIMVAVPFIYSYSIYRKHKKNGVEYEPVFRSEKDKIAGKITIITVPLIFAFVAVLMFTGGVQYEITENQLQIEATYFDDLTVDLSTVEKIEFRESFSFGSRSYGFGSAKLSLGLFENDEFGTYTLYGYTGSDAAVVLIKGEDVLVITAQSDADTKNLYELLKESVK